MRGAVHGNLMLLHALQQCGLGAWCGTVDLVRQQNLGEHSTLPKDKALLRRIKNADSHQIGRHQIRRKLDAPECRLHGLRQCPCQRGLSRSGNVVKKHVPAAEQRCKQLVHHILLAQNHLRNAVSQRLCYFLYF